MNFFFNYIFFTKGEPSPLNNGMAGASKVLPVTILADWICFSFSFHENENADKNFRFYRGLARPKTIDEQALVNVLPCGSPATYNRIILEASIEYIKATK